MDESFWKLVQGIVPNVSSNQADNALRSREKQIRILLQHKKVPDAGWDDATIELLLNRLALMDSNNFSNACGVGEREGRIVSDIVARRHFRFGHGIGKSGDLTEIQPKACGSSLLYKLTNCMVQDLFKLMGIQTCIECVVVPVCTGMSLVLCMLALRSSRPKAKYVIWSRVDQKSCFKSISTAGYIPIVIDPSVKGDLLGTNVSALEEKLKDLNEEVLCVMSTTSCFAPRLCDNIEFIAKLCKTYGVPHLVNNAYGLQSKNIMNRIQKAQRVGRIDILVQSTDKNLMVPVGGAIIASFDKTLMKQISSTYPGRASSDPIIDVFITLLSIGKQGYQKYVLEREKCFEELQEGLRKCCDTYGEKVLYSPENPISIGVTLSTFEKQDLTKIGSMLFVRNVSGARVVDLTESKTIGTHHFIKWGCHNDKVTTPYLTAAAGIGMQSSDVKMFIEKLDKVFKKYKQNTFHDAVQECTSNE